MDVAFDADSVYLVQELAEGGDLFNLVSSVGVLPETRARGIFRQVASAVSYCHSQSVFHRDIKMENILLVTNNSDDVKLTDFGLAKDCMESYEGPKTMQVGTISFMAPEIAGFGRGQGYEGAPVDVWGLGCTLFVMTTGEFPFGEDGRNVGRTFRRIKEGAAGIDWEIDSRGRTRTLSHSLVALLQGMLSSDPAGRLDLKDVVASEWFQADGYVDRLSATTLVQAPQHGSTGESAVRTIEWPEETRRHELAQDFLAPVQPPLLLEAEQPPLLLDGIDGFDIGLDLSDLDTPPVSTPPPSSAPDTRSAGARARTVHFATSPRVIAADTPATEVVRASRFHCSPIHDSCGPTVVVARQREQASTSAPVVYVEGQRDAQQEALQREEQVAMDKLLAERLAESEKTDQRTLQVQIEQADGERDDVLVIPDGLECPITNELFEDPVMCTDGTTAV